MKKRLIQHSEIEYDEAFDFWPEQTPKCGDLLESPIAHAGGVFWFQGTAIVVSTETSSESPLETAYIEIHPTIT